MAPPITPAIAGCIIAGVVTGVGTLHTFPTCGVHTLEEMNSQVLELGHQEQMSSCAAQMLQLEICGQLHAVIT